MLYESPRGLNWRNCVLEVNLEGGTRLWEGHETLESAAKAARARVEFTVVHCPNAYLDIVIYQGFKLKYRMVANHGHVLYNEWR